MSTSFKIPGLVITALAAVALAAPGAGAMPTHEPSEFDAGHAAVAQAHAPKQDLRSPDARDAAIHPQRVVHAQRSQVAVTASGPRWAVNPTPMHSTTQVVADDDGGLAWLTIVLGVAGGLALAGVAFAATHRMRHRGAIA
jgi:hypothetical protein